MRLAPSLSRTKALAVALCSTALTGCPQLQHDDFRVVAVEADAGGSSPGGTSGGNGIGAGAGGSTQSNIAGAGGTTGGGGFSNVSDMGGVAGTGGADNTGGAGDAGGTSNTGGAGDVGGTNSTGGAGTGGTSNTGTAGNSGGAGNTGGNTGGASNTGGLCVSGPFANVEPITGLNVSGQQWGPTLSADGLTLFFDLYAANADHLYVATRSSRGSVFSQAVAVPVQGANTIQAAPFLSSSGLNLYFAATPLAGSADRDIWLASRADISVAAFSNAAALREVNTTSYENRPWVSNDELTILFVSSRTGGAGDFDIWTATRPSRSQAFSNPTNLTTVNTSFRDESPIMSNDGLTLYFASTRPGGAGKQDIWTATRSDAQSPFSSPTALKALNGSNEELDLALSRDEAELFFVSDAPTDAPSGTPQLWRATRNCATNEP